MTNLTEWLEQNYPYIYEVWLHDSSPEHLTSLEAYLKKNYPSVWKEYNSQKP